jgi:hypothetical protein
MLVVLADQDRIATRRQERGSAKTNDPRDLGANPWRHAIFLWDRAAQTTHRKPLNLSRVMGRETRSFRTFDSIVATVNNGSWR